MTRLPGPRRQPRGTIRGTRNGKAPGSSLNPRSDCTPLDILFISSNSISLPKDTPRRVSSDLKAAASLPFGATLRVIPGRGLARGLGPPSTPILGGRERSIMSARREVWVKILSQRGGAVRVARQGPLRRVIALRSGAALGWPGAHPGRSRTLSWSESAPASWRESGRT